MQKHYSYLNDWDFLKEIDNLIVQERYVKITLLDYKTEKELDSIEGEISDGSLTKDGSSAARCSCSLSCTVDGYSYNIYDIKSKYSINKKIFVEIGIANDTNKHKEIPIVWFPQGVMIITDFSISSSAGGAISIQLKFKDKICLLDGTVGGMLPATTRFDILTELVDGESVNKKVPVYQIIQEAVNHFGGEPISNILIEDIPDKARRALKWTSATPLWILSREETSESGLQTINYYAYRQDDFGSIDSGNWDGQCFRAGYDVGFVYEDFVYDKELTFNAGSTIVQLLDTIKNWLGNFEYFYDEYGIFHFREVKNYLNTSVSTYEWTKNFTDKDYIYNPVNSGVTYDFTDGVNLISMSATPQYQNIKNDYVIIGKNKTAGGSTDVIYHFVIDEKPTITEEGYSNILLYTDSSIGKYALAYPQMLTKEEFESLESGDLGQIYGVNFDIDEIKSSRNAKTVADFFKLFDSLINIEMPSINGGTVPPEDGKIDLLINKEDFGSFDPTKDIFDIKSKVDEIINSTMLGLNETIIKPVLYFLIDCKKCGVQVLDDNTKLRLETFCKNMIASTNISDDIKKSYRAIFYILNPKQNTSNGDNTITVIPEGKLEYLEFYKTTYWDYSSLKEKIINLTNQYSEIYSNKDVTLYENFYSNCTGVISLLKKYISNINSYLSNASKGMYKFDSTRYKYLKELTELLQQLKSVVEALLTEAYQILGTSTLTAPSDFVYNKIDETYNVGDTLNFYSWNGLRKQWDKVEWTYYYKEDGGYHYIDFSDERLYGLMTDPSVENVPSMKCNSPWYTNNFVKYIQNHHLESEIPYVGSGQLKAYTAEDWRTEIILQGLSAEKTGAKKSEYYPELLANWPIIYNLKTQSYYSSTNLTDDFYSGDMAVLNNEEDLNYTNDLGGNVSLHDSSNNRQRISFKQHGTDEDGNTYELVINTGYSDNTITGNYFFDMLDARASKWGEYSVSNIGCRRIVVSNEDINCLFSQPLPEFGFIFRDGKTAEEINVERELIKQNGCNQVIVVDSDIYNYFATGGNSNGAYDTLRYNLLTHINYQETVSISVRPIFYLSPNSLINIYEGTTGINGKFVSKTLNIPLKVGSNMTINATRAEEKI